MKNFENAKRKGALLLDGATGTNLYLRGLPEGVCVEKWIAEHPEAILDLQKGFAAAGSDVVYAPTFGANRIKLSHFGLGDEEEALNKTLVGLSKQAAPGCYVAGDMSPTGCFIEPFGDKSLDEIVACYTEQAKALNEAGVDLFIIETMMSLSEARAAVLACRDFGKPVFVTITVDENGKTLTGASLANVIVVLQELGVTACGINCSCPPAVVKQYILAAQQVAKIPMIVKPNAGKPDPEHPGQYDMTPEKMAADMKELVESGISIIGGCCGNTEAHIAALREMLDGAEIPDLKPHSEQEILLADESRLYRLTPGEITFSEEFACDEDLLDNLMDAADEEVDCALIRVETPEEAQILAQETAQVRLPVCIVSEDWKALERALYLYNGRAMVKTDLDFDLSRYGAVKYED